jgi:hypothetical protein
MGRPNYPNSYNRPEGFNQEAPHKLRLIRVPFVDGDYDRGGAYWGQGSMPLYVAWNDEITEFTRAATRTDAKERIRRSYPAAKFYR